MGKPGMDWAPSPVNPGSSPPGKRCVPNAAPPNSRGGDITWPTQVAPRAERRLVPAISNLKPQTAFATDARHAVRTMGTVTRHRAPE